jgi:hypothetical protein
VPRCHSWMLRHFYLAISAKGIALVKKSGIDLITIKEARKVLGVQYKRCIDEEIEQMIMQADFMAAVALEKMVPKTSEVS